MDTAGTTRRSFLKNIIMSSAALAVPALTRAGAAMKRPNVLVIFADDLGFGDLGIFGHPTIRTPNLDRMAMDGQKWTNFYAAASVCTPSRAGLMTGRLPIRSGMCSDKRRVLFPDSASGLPDKNYNVPLMRNEEIIERPANQNTLTKRYTEKTIKFIRENKDQPWFVYLAHSMVHIPLFASEQFRGKSPRGIFGDTVEEIDAGVGRILQTLKDLSLDKNTLVVFTSDNGPWLPFREHAGSAGLLRDGKGTTWEGGMREPTIFYWPGKIKPGPVMGIGSTLDLFATITSLAGAKIPAGRIMDSYDLGPTLFQRKPSPRTVMFYYRGQHLFAVRKGAYKAHFVTMTAYQKDNHREEHDPPLLFHINHDPGENFDISAQHPDIIEDILKTVREHRDKLIVGEDQLAKKL